MKEKYETCVHVREVGTVAVYVFPTCQRKMIRKGKMVSTKLTCKNCTTGYKERKNDGGAGNEAI